MDEQRMDGQRGRKGGKEGGKEGRTGGWRDEGGMGRRGERRPTPIPTPAAGFASGDGPGQGLLIQGLESDGLEFFSYKQCDLGQCTHPL